MGFLPHSNVPTVATSAEQFFDVFGHAFTGSIADVNALMAAIADGRIVAATQYVDPTNGANLTAPFYTDSDDKIVISGSSSTWFASMVRSGEIERMIESNEAGRITTDWDLGGTQQWTWQTTTIDWAGELKSINTLHDDLTRTFQEYDTDNSKPWNSQTTKYTTSGGIASIKDELPGNVIVEKIWTQFENGEPVGEPERRISYKQVAINGESIGTLFGSSLGQLIGGDNVFAQVAAGTALSALLGNVGQTLDLFFKDGSSTAGSLEDAAIAAFDDFGANLAGAFQSAAVGAVSSFLTGELAQALNFDGASLGDQLLRAAVNATTSMLINTVVSNVGQGLQLFNGLAGGNPATAVASFVGTYLAKQIVTPQNLGGAIGASLGSSLGALGASALLGSVIGSLALGNAIGTAAAIILGVAVPGIGALVGAILGTLLGNALGELFSGDAAEGHGGTWLAPGEQQFHAVQATGNNGTIVNGEIVPLQNATTAVLNGYLQAIGGTLVADAYLSVGFDTIIPTHSVSTHAFRLSGNTVVTQGFGASAGGMTGEAAVEFAVLHLVKELHAAGGNLYVKRAIAVSTATTLEQLSGEIKIAEDYGRYLANKDLIDTLVALYPDSAFAAGWVVTLLRAEELGITTLNRSDFYGGVVPFLKSFGLERFGATLADVSVGLEGTKLVVTIAQEGGQAARRIEIDNYATLTGLTQLAASPTGAAVNGGNGDDLWIAAAGVASTFTDVSRRACARRPGRACIRRLGRALQGRSRPSSTGYGETQHLACATRDLAHEAHTLRRRPRKDAGSRCARRQPTCSARLAAGTSRLRPQDWKSGDRLRVVEVNAPFGGADEMVKDLEAKVFPQQQMKCLALGPQGREVRVV